jgi:ComF family protein
VCAACWASIRPAPAAPRPSHLDQFRALADFSGPLRDVVLSFKYRGKGYLARPLGEWMAAHAPDWTRDCDLVVGVPAPFRRRVFRGYHPAGVLAGVVARRLQRPFETRALRRLGGFPSQTALDRRHRRENAERSFSAGSRAANVRGLRVLLVDDVSTTGATLSRCAELLRRAGAVSVTGLVLAQEGLAVEEKPRKISGISARTSSRALSGRR